MMEKQERGKKEEGRKIEEPLKSLAEEMEIVEEKLTKALEF